MHQAANFGGEPDVAMGEATKRLEKDVRAAPGRGAPRDVEDELICNSAQAPVDLGLFWKLLLEQADAHARQGSFERVELLRQVHEARLRLGDEPRNLVASEIELI